MENEQKLMKEYEGIYGKSNNEVQGEGQPLQCLSENDISNQIDKEMSEDKGNDDLEWLIVIMAFEFYITILWRYHITAQYVSYKLQAITRYSWDADTYSAMVVSKTT